MDYMNRVRSLRLWQRAIDWDYLRFRGIRAPNIQVLRFTENQASFVNVNRIDSPILMPKVRQLEVSGGPSATWRRLLPSHLPTVTDLTLTDLDSEDELDILRRCTSVLRLSVHWQSRSFITIDHPLQALTFTA
ncbi:hypothetical protein AX16_005115 [Volvariella volvacea WC 439]|nr:hypothetical protein AX16_005115 [Volvariella volvacea WC 439]